MNPYSWILVALLVTVYGLVVVQSGQVENSVSFCVGEGQAVSHLFRLYDQLYLGLVQQPNVHLLYFLNNDTFASESVTVEQLMGADNHHIFESIVSIATLGQDYFDQFHEQTNRNIHKTNPIKQLTFLSKLSTVRSGVSDSLKINKRIKRSRDLNSSLRDKLNDDYDYNEEDIISDQTQRPSPRVFSDRKTTKKITFLSKKVSTASSLKQSNKAEDYEKLVLVRIWGRIDLGPLPRSPQLFQAIKAIPKFGYEDFFYDLTTHTLEPVYQSDDSDDSWQNKRSHFSFDCLIHFAPFGSVAIVHIRHKPTILRYQLDKLRYRSSSMSFDVYLKVFYSEQKFDSCVDLGEVVALLMPNHRRLVLIDRNDLKRSFTANDSQVDSFVQTDLKKLLCSRRKSLSASVKSFLAKIKLQKLFSVSQTKHSNKSLVQGNISKLENTPKLMTLKPEVNNRMADEVTNLPVNSYILNQTLFVMMVVLCAVVVIVVAVGSVFLFIKPSKSSVQQKENIKLYTSKKVFSKVGLNLESSLKPV